MIERAKYAKIWLEKFAPDEVKFKVSKKLPEEAKTLSNTQRQFLGKLGNIVTNEEDIKIFQDNIYNLGKTQGLGSRDTFRAIYIALLGKDYGPKAASLILALESEFVKKRFKESSGG